MFQFSELVIGTTKTPSGQTHAAFDSPQVTQRTEGAQRRCSFRCRFVQGDKLRCGFIDLVNSGLYLKYAPFSTIQLNYRVDFPAVVILITIKICSERDFQIPFHQSLNINLKILMSLISLLTDSHKSDAITDISTLGGSPIS